MRILLLTTRIPFVRGGAEILVEQLREALIAENHEAEIISVPFKWYPPEQLIRLALACRQFDLSEFDQRRIDRVIGLKFPAYLIQHPEKVMWLLHQHRSAYDLWDDAHGGDLITWPNGQQVRDAIRQADARLIPEAKAIYTISGNVSARLQRYSGIASTPLHPPPHDADRYFAGKADDYFFLPSRVNRLKRQELVIEALAHTLNPVRVRFAGVADNPAVEGRLTALANTLQVESRVEWLGGISDEQKWQLYAHCLAVVYPPRDEDYGYVTLEAMLAERAVVTCHDSGGPLDFVRHGETGLITAPTAVALAAALDQLWDDRAGAKRMGQNGRQLYREHGISWKRVVERLVA